LKTRQTPFSNCSTLIFRLDPTCFNICARLSFYADLKIFSNNSKGYNLLSTNGSISAKPVMPKFVSYYYNFCPNGPRCSALNRIRRPIRWVIAVVISMFRLI